jgi:predicted dienelactone hydrolase
MRPVEILLVVANLLTFLVVAVPRLHAARWMGGVVLITLSLAVVQVLLEGPRWQMVPAYVLTGLFLFVWVVQSFVPVGGIVKEILTNRLVAGCAIILAIMGLGLSTALPIVLPVFHFSLPSGPYAIGTVTYQWTDVSRREVFSPDKQMRRELMAQVWYPAKKGSSSSHTLYIPDSDAVTTALARLHHLPDFFGNYLKYVTTHAAESVPVADDQPSYPVLIYLEGLTGYRQMSIFQVEELVSHGYIVVGIDQPGVAATVVFPDGHQLAITGLLPQIQSLEQQSLSPAEQAPQLLGQTFKDGIIPYFVQDVSFTLDQLASLNSTDPKGILTGKLDLEHIGMFGISFGGMVGAQACLQDPRLKACLVMDVWMTADVVHSGLRQPSMWITRPADTMRLERQEDGGWSEQAIALTQSTMRAVYNHLPGDGYFVQVPGMFHIDFTDLDLLSPIFIPGIGGGPIGSQRAHEIVNAYSLAFFDKHLKGEPQALLDGPAAHYPEVIFEKRGP